MSDLLLLPAWLDAGAATLAGAAPPAQTLDAALPGLAQAQSLTPAQRLQRVQASGLAECGRAGEPIYLAWRQFLRGHGPSVLVIDATGLDSRELGMAAVLDGASWLLAEGVLIAASLRDSRKVELRLPAELTGHEAALLNTAEAIQRLKQASVPHIQLQVQRNSRPSYWGEGQPGDGSRLVHTPETWCRIALLFAGAADLDASLLTLRRGMKQRGLVELARAANLRSQIEAWGGGVEVQGEDPVLVFDDGLGGFLPLSKADQASDPVALAAAGIIPAPSSLMVLAGGVCVVKQTRRALYRHWQLTDGEATPVRSLLARAARLVTEITLGRGEAGHLVALDEVALELAAQGLAAAWPLTSSLRHYRAQWESHVRRESCPEGLCLVRNAAPCHSTCPANIDIPSFIAHLGHGDYRATIEVIRRDNPLPLVCGLVCPAPCESACVRGGSNGPVFIRTLKAKAAEHCLAEGGYPQPEIAPATGKRIGIVGSGPSSLTAAYYLRTYGHGSRSSRHWRRRGASCAMAFRPIACRPTCSIRRSSRSRCWGWRSTPTPPSTTLRSSARTMMPYSSVSAPSGRAHPNRGRPPTLRTRRDRLPACRAQRRTGAGRAARRRHRRRQRLHRRSPDGAAARCAAGRVDLAGEAPRHAGQPARDRNRRCRGCAIAPELWPRTHR